MRKTLRTSFPGVVQRVCDKLWENDIKRADDIAAQKEDVYEPLLDEILKAIQKVARCKTKTSPMLASKLLHMFLPEIFPVWDHTWIHDVCLKSEPPCDEDWLLDYLDKYDESAQQYARYFCLMLSDLHEISHDQHEQYEELEKTYVAAAEATGIPKVVIRWHFVSLDSIIFEACLLGKHADEIAERKSKA